MVRESSAVPQPVSLPTMYKIRIRAKTCALLLSMLLASPATGTAQEAASATADAAARSIVEKADQVRFPTEGFQVDVDIVTTRQGQRADSRKYRVLSKGNDNTIVQTLEPASERGQSMLMRGRDLWVYMPNVSQPVRLALSQRLTGQVANGDLARANFAGDYNPKVLRTETLDGQNYHVLELTAVDRGVTYQRVVYWVRQDNSWPLKAEFYSQSNRLLKTCKYEKFQNLAGRVRPTRLTMDDALRQGEQSVLDYYDMKPRDLPDRMFTKEHLRRLD
jgi:outer membrane lipoprotein-sorting protein